MTESRIQSISVKLYEDYFEKYKTKDKKCLPTIEIEIEALGYKFELDTKEKSQGKQLAVKEVKGFACSLHKRSVNQ